jgi:hypothetical protein
VSGAIDSQLAFTAFMWTFASVALAMLAGPLAGWLWRTPQREGFPMGLCVFMLIIGSVAGISAARLAHASWQFQQASKEVQGVLVEFVSGSYYDSKLRRTVPTLRPRIEFSAADGTAHSFKGPEGSLAGQKPGTAVRLLYRADQPEEAALAGFQSQWGAAWVFGLLGGGALLVATVIGRGLFAPAEQKVRAPGLVSRAWGTWLALALACLYVGLGVWALRWP